jgi:acyl carrier protein phosphodiesterase
VSGTHPNDFRSMVQMHQRIDQVQHSLPQLGKAR